MSEQMADVGRPLRPAPCQERSEIDRRTTLGVFRHVNATHPAIHTSETKVELLCNLSDGAACVIESADFIEHAGARLLYLPPYSLDLNPIEQAFAKLKALLRAKALRTVEALWNALGDIVSCFSPDECANFLRHAGYF